MICSADLQSGRRSSCWPVNLVLLPVGGANADQLELRTVGPLVAQMPPIEIRAPFGRKKKGISKVKVVVVVDLSNTPRQNKRASNKELTPASQTYTHSSTCTRVPPPLAHIAHTQCTQSCPIHSNKWSASAQERFGQMPWIVRVPVHSRPYGCGREQSKGDDGGRQRN